MGAGMAGRLIDARHRILVWNRGPAKEGPFAVAGQARQLRPELPILTMSGYRDQREIRQAWQVGYSENRSTFADCRMRCEA